jgi:sugar transferase EpsL
MAGFYQRVGKRVVDLAVGLPVLAVAAPVIGALALAVRQNMGKPAFFRQERPGLGGEPFELIKLRTMRDARDAKGNPLPDSERLTKFGQFLRSSSLDELPTLINVVRGDMSLVGPRPLLMQYLERYSAEQRKRHDVRPGVTGWAQINGRNAIGWDEKFALDVWYVDHLSAALDFSILAKTAWAVVTRQGISADGHVTMPEFMGPEAGRSRAAGNGRMLS